MSCSKLLLTLGLLIIFASCQKTPEPTPDPLPAREELALSYGTHPQQMLDAYFPEAANTQTPVVFMLHGGGWIEGDKSEFSARAAAFRNEGFIVLNMNYRLADSTGIHATPPQHVASAVRMAQQLDDIDSAVAFYKRKAAGWGTSTTRLFMAGHSAGAHLSMLYVQGSHNSSGYIRASGNWCGTTDLTVASDSFTTTAPPEWVAYFKELLWRTTGFEPKMANNLAFMALSPYWQANNTGGRPNISCMAENNDPIIFAPPFQTTNQHVANFHTLLTNRGITNRNIIYTGEYHGMDTYPDTWGKVIHETAVFFKAIP